MANNEFTEYIGCVQLCPNGASANGTDGSDLHAKIISPDDAQHLYGRVEVTAMHVTTEITPLNLRQHQIYSTYIAAETAALSVATDEQHSFQRQIVCAVFFACLFFLDAVVAFVYMKE